VESRRRTLFAGPADSVDEVRREVEEACDGFIENQAGSGRFPCSRDNACRTGEHYPFRAGERLGARPSRRNAMLYLR
jgi:hypothetical protein